MVRHYIYLKNWHALLESKAYPRLHDPIFHSHNDEDHDNHPVWVLLPFTTSYNVMFVFLYITMIFTIVFKMQPFSHVRGPHIHRRPCWWYMPCLFVLLRTSLTDRDKPVFSKLALFSARAEELGVFNKPTDILHISFDKHWNVAS